jgi:proteasome beta subunit
VHGERTGVVDFPGDRLITGDATDSSFIRLLQGNAAELLPWNRIKQDTTKVTGAPHGTTVLAVIHADGVLVAGDRRATMGNLIAQRDLEKVYPADEYCAIAFAGTVGLAVDLVRLYQLELEHYEKIEGVPLSIEGKVNKLGQMIRANFGAAQQGLAVIPLFGGYDLVLGKGRIFSSDVVGHVTEDHEFEAVGSGSLFAKGSLKKLFRPGMTEAEVARICVEALFDAADEDTATGGPDIPREIYPTLATVTADGYRRYTEAESGEIVRAVAAQR